MAVSAIKTAGDLLVRYENYSVLRALIKLIPLGIGGAGDTLLGAKAQKIKIERARIFFDELANGKQKLADELIDSDEFLHCFFRTSEAALKTRRSEKIQLFARLLKSSVSGTSPRGSDELEELISILDELSYSEWSALVLLDSYSATPRLPTENDLQWARKYWGQFQNAITVKLLVPNEEVTAFMSRITRTGLCEILTGYYDETGEIGKLTPRFHRLKSLVLGTES